ncbi:MAG TPA: hypothetical protein PKW95_03430 [bacterium]|nr:hypothetical protein [bacterium]
MSYLEKSLPALLWDVFKIFITFILGAATYWGSPISELLNKHWLSIALGLALCMSLFIIFRRGVTNFHYGSNEGIIVAVARREELNNKRVIDALSKAKNIEMAGFNLRSPWFSGSSKFEKMIESRLKTESDLKIKIIIADPDCDSLKTRNIMEDGCDTGRMKADGDSALNFLGELQDKASNNAVEIKLVDADMINMSVIIAEERMFATCYMTFVGGSKSPAFEISGSKTKYYTVFKDEFDRLWKRGRQVQRQI